MSYSYIIRSYKRESGGSSKTSSLRRFSVSQQVSASVHFFFLACVQTCACTVSLGGVFKGFVKQVTPQPLSVSPWYAPIIPLTANAKLTLIPKHITLLPFRVWVHQMWMQPPTLRWCLGPAIFFSFRLFKVMKQEVQDTWYDIWDNMIWYDMICKLMCFWCVRVCALGALLRCGPAAAQCSRLD